MSTGNVPDKAGSFTGFIRVAAFQGVDDDVEVSLELVAKVLVGVEVVLGRRSWEGTLERVS